jgi:hypothetical protein
MPLPQKNLAYFKALKLPDNPEFGAKLGEWMEEMGQAFNNIEGQNNSNATGQPQTPPAINSLNVTASNGHFQIAINHEGAQFYRGIRYFVEHSDNAQFTNSHTEDLGTTRNANLFLGNATRFFRAFAAYPSSPPGPLAYHGSAGQPLAVTGGGTVPAPNFAASQGSGTGTPGQGHSGPGPTPYRTSTGAPPSR